MRKTRLILTIVIVIVIAVLIAFLFLLHTENLFNLSAPINSQRFSEYATFMSGLFSIVTIIYIYQAYQQSQHTSIENTFFNLLQGHQNLVAHLHQRITVRLQKEFEDSYKEIHKGFGSGRTDNDFFELQYAKLSLAYRPKESSQMDVANVGNYFQGQNWVMGHYFRSLITFIQWVHSHRNLEEQEKRFYVDFIESQTSSDELRLLFYWAISRSENTRTDICKVLHHYDFFRSINGELIYQEQDGDWTLFLRIVQ